MNNFINGRLNRKQFLLRFIIQVIVFLAASTVFDSLENESLYKVFFYLLSLFVRRLNDTKQSKLWILLNFIPLLSFLFLLYLCFARTVISTERRHESLNSLPLSQEIILKVNTANLFSRVRIIYFIFILLTFFVLLLYLAITTVPAPVKIFMFFVILGWYTFLFVLLLKVTQSQIIFKKETIVIKRLFRTYEIAYKDIFEIRRRGFTWGFYFSLYE